MTNAIILGGTGTLGTALARELLSLSHTRVTVLSRGEHKQKQMAAEFNHNERLSFVIGDIRDRDTLFNHLAGNDVCFHVAALKHVDTGEENPEEFLKTDALATINVADAAVYNRIPYVVFSSTDKAVDPILLYGACKLASEKILFARNKRQRHTRFSVFRWGNILGSNGSVLHGMVRSIKASGSYDLTHPDMTRFFLRINEAAKFMLDHYESAPLDSVLVPSFKSAKITDLADAAASVLGLPKPVPRIIGIRQTEKLHEVLSSAHTPMAQISSKDNLMSMNELVDLIAPIVTEIASA